MPSRLSRCRVESRSFMVAPTPALPPPWQGREKNQLTPLTGYPVGACQRHLRHRRCLDRQGSQVFSLQVVHVRFAAGPCQRRQLQRQDRQVILQSARALLDLEPLLQFFVLRRDPDRTAPRVTVMTETRRRSESVIFLGHINLFLSGTTVIAAVTAQSDQRALANRDSVGAHR